MPSRHSASARGWRPTRSASCSAATREALALLRGLETGELADAEFERRFGELLGLADHDGLIDRMFADLRPDEAMIGAVRAARSAGVRTGLISNSWGLGIYDRAPIELFDATVISGEVGLHKPQPEIYLLACERLGIEPAAAVFVDDLRENCVGAEAVGMTAVLPPRRGRDDRPARGAARRRARGRGLGLSSDPVEAPVVAAPDRLQVVEAGVDQRDLVLGQVVEVGVGDGDVADLVLGSSHSR